MSGPSLSLPTHRRAIKEGSKVINVILLTTKHADCRIIFILNLKHLLHLIIF